MREIPKKNYLILFLILALTVGLTFYAREWYNTSREYYARNSVIKEATYEINDEEIYSYAVEKPRFILYASSGTDIDIKNFETNLKKLIVKYEMSDDIVYLNLDNVDISLFNENLKNRYASDKFNFSNDSLSTFYVFKDGKITMVLNNVDEYSTKYLANFFEKWSGSNG